MFLVISIPDVMLELCQYGPVCMNCYDKANYAAPIVYNESTEIEDANTLEDDSEGIKGVCMYVFSRVDKYDI
jgi:hypothetical protein